MAIVQGSVTTTTFVTGLKRTTAYTFSITSTNEIGESQKSDASMSITSQNFRKYIFVSDFLNDRVLRFDFATKAFMDVFIQKGSGGLRGPWGLAFNKYDDPAQPRTFYVASRELAASFNTMHATAPSSSSSHTFLDSLVASSSICCHLHTSHHVSRRCCWSAAHMATVFLSTTR